MLKMLLGGKNKKRGGRVIELSAKEIAEKEELNARHEGLLAQFKKLEFSLKEMLYQNELWGIGIRKNHNFQNGDFQYEDGKIFEMVKAE